MMDEKMRERSMTLRRFGRKWNVFGCRRNVERERKGKIFMSNRSK